MSPLKKAGIVVGVLAVSFLVFVSQRPNHYYIERSIEVPASPELILNKVADFNAWPLWSPWEKLDPNMQKEVMGTPKTVGHKYTWSGNKDAGKGNMIITSFSASEVHYNLAFEEPFTSSSKTSFVLAPSNASSPEAPQTEVTWIMEGDNNFVGKLFTVFMNMDDMIGKDFSEGLHNLKAVIEKETKSPH